MFGQLKVSNDPNAKDFYMTDQTPFEHLSGSSPAGIWIRDLRHLQHPPSLPLTAPPYAVSIPPDALQQMEQHGVVWVKQKPAFGQQGNRNPFQEAESWVRNSKITSYALDTRRKNPVNAASQSVISALYGDHRVEVPYTKLGAFVRGPKPVTNPKAPAMTYASPSHTDNPHAGPTDQVVLEHLHFWGVIPNTVKLETLEIINQWSVLTPSQQMPLVLQAHSSLGNVKERFCAADISGIYPMSQYHPDDLYLYLSNMQVEDVLVFKQFSHQHPQKSRIAHFAAAHPDFPVIAEELEFEKGARYSLEKRSLTFETK